MFGAPLEAIRLTTTFFVGTCFYLYRESIIPRLTGKAAVACTIVCLCLMYRDIVLAQAAAITFGAAALFWLAFKAPLGPIRRINDGWDISYGVYLYGWPVTVAVLWLNRGIDPVSLAAFAVPLSLLCGALSWFGIGRWTKDIVRPGAAKRLVSTG